MYTHQAMQNNISKFLSQEFSNDPSMQRLYDGIKIRFLDSFVIRVRSHDKQFFNAEKFIPKNKFERYTDNIGGIASDCPKILLEFSLWTLRYRVVLTMVLTWL